MRFVIDHALLARAQEKLSGRTLLWIAGGAGSGKTTVCQALSTRLGLSVYDMDAHIYGSYHGRFSPTRHPVNMVWSTAPDGLAWLLGLSWDEFDSFNRAALPEYLDLLCDDLDEVDLNSALLVDGGLCNPGLLAQVLPTRQIACLAAPEVSSVKVWEQTGERAAMKDAIARLPNPEAAWRTFLEFDARITQTILDECRQNGISIYLRDDTTSVEELAQRIVNCELSIVNFRTPDPPLTIDN